SSAATDSIRGSVARAAASVKEAMTIHARETWRSATSMQDPHGPRHLRHLLALCVAGMWLALPVAARAQQGWSGTVTATQTVVVH
ncbi:MAG: hypothetical protein OEW19_12150, partial [Acidobacteriota bacterium]|nr:hypothetical protein [Acidobacteriota bacterium]